MRDVEKRTEPSRTKMTALLDLRWILIGLMIIVMIVLLAYFLRAFVPG